MNIHWKRWILEAVQVILTIVMALLMGALVMHCLLYTSPSPRD